MNTNSTAKRAEILPTPLVVGLTLFLAFAVLAVGLSSKGLNGSAAEANGNTQTVGGDLSNRQMTGSHWLRFSDQDDGSVSILDAQSGTLIDSLAPGSNGFARGLLRGMNRERRKSGLTMVEPFELGRNRDGQLVLRDPLLGSEIVMSAFGHTNEAVFDRLYAKASTQSGQPGQVARSIGSTT